MFKKLAAAIALTAIAAALALTAPLSASAATGTADVTASPDTIAVGESSTITVTGLGDLTTAGIGTDGTIPGGTFSTGSGEGTPSADLAVSGGRATIDFSATQAGVFTIAVSDGETVVGTTTVTVTGAQPVQWTVEASPESITAGETSTITAKGLNGMSQVTFGLSGPSGGSLSTGSGAGSTTVQAAVTGGIATVEFTAEGAGTFTIAMGDGETSLAQTTVTVEAATPTPTPSPTPPAPAPTTDSFPWLILWIVIGAVVLAGVVTTIVIVARKRSTHDGGADA